MLGGVGEKFTIKPATRSFPPYGSDGAISLIKQKTRKKADAISPVFEPKPGFEPGTPSLRVKCSTAELFQRCGLSIN